MENNATLKELAMGAAFSSHAETELPTKEEMEATNNKTGDRSVEYVGSTAVIISQPTKDTTAMSNVPESTADMGIRELMNTPTPSMVGLDEDTLSSQPSNTGMNPLATPSVQSVNTVMHPDQMAMLAEIMPNISETKRIEIAQPIITNREKIVKDLLINMGLTIEEANTAADNQIRKKLSEAYNEYMNNSTPTVCVVTINKTDDPNNLGLTKEEHKKLEKVNKVRLVVVEDVELANIVIERPDEEHKADYVKSIEGSLSKYSVPMPMLGDFLSFRGAQMVQMVNIVNYEDSRIDEIISTKASLIYEKLIGGTIMQKYDASGKSVLSYSEFANKFPYQDIDMALYGILCASSMEENSTSLTCNSCSHQWIQNYNLKSLLKLDTLSEAFKARVDGILNYKSNDIEMRKLYDSMRKAKRFKSPFTNNIYDLSYPTIARATNLLKRINADDNVMTYLSAVALYLSRILIYNEAKRSYVEISAEETPLLLETMKTLSNEDVNMLAKQIREDLYYAPQFILPAKCPECGKVSELPVSVEQLIFLTAQDSMVEIDN